MTPVDERDVMELQHLISITKSPRILNVLQSTLSKASTSETKKNDVVFSNQPNNNNNNAVVYENLDKFGWEDAGYGKEKVSVYLMSNVDGVGELPLDQIDCHFTKTSFDLKVHGLNGRNLRLVQSHLDKEINPERSFYRVKANRITIVLIKQNKDQVWMNLNSKSGKTESKSSDSSDPSAGIMNLMKNMYEEGDDEIKRTIAKAWTENQTKNAL